MRDIAEIKAAFDLTGIMHHYAKGENKDKIGLQYDVLAWILCEGESAEPFESFLDIGRRLPAKTPNVNGTTDRRRYAIGGFCDCSR